LIVHIGNKEQIAQLTSEISAPAQKLIDFFFPGPLTVVVKKSGRVSELATAGLETIGVRMPQNKIASEFLQRCATPVVAPSANISGRPSPTTWQAVLEDLDGKIDCILKGEPTKFGLESTVIDCASEKVRVLRSGSISLEDLKKIVPEISLAGEKEEGAAKSPGIRHQHYAPEAKVEIVSSAQKATAGKKNAFIGLENPPGEFGAVKIVSSKDDYARELFEFFRACDRVGVEKIFCEKTDETGIGLALMDRIRRASKR
jgi:L-threonylcarbamoyladenylate synthase